MNSVRTSTDQSRPARRVRCIVIAAICAFIALLSAVAPNMKGRPGDLEVFITAGERLKSGEDIYRPGPGAFTYPPFIAVPFTLLTAAPESWQRPVWYFINFACVAAVMALVARRMTPHLRARAPAHGAPAWSYWIIVLALTARHLLAPIENQQFDLIVLLLVILTIDGACVRREIFSGALAGLAAASKATPLLFGPVLFWQRRWWAATAMLAAIVLATLLPDVLFPARDGGLWVSRWYQTFVSKVGVGDSPNVPGAWASWNMLNQSLAGTVYRLSTPVTAPVEHAFDVSLWSPGSKSIKWLTLALQGAVMGWLLLVTRPALTRHARGAEFSFRRFGEGGAVVCAMLLLSPMSSKAHFCVLLIPVAFCLADFLYHERHWFVAAMLTTMFLLGTATAIDIVGRDLGRAFLARGSVTWCTVAGFAATGWILLRRAKANDAALN